MVARRPHRQFETARCELMMCDRDRCICLCAVHSNAMYFFRGAIARNALRDSNGLVYWDALTTFLISCRKVQIVDHWHHLDLTILSFTVVLGMDGIYTSRGNLTDLLQSPTLLLRMTGVLEPTSKKWGSVDTKQNFDFENEQPQPLWPPSQDLDGENNV